MSETINDLGQQIHEYKKLLSSVYLYIKWYEVTRQLTTEQKELFADAVDKSFMERQVADGEEPRAVAERWWHDDYPLEKLELLRTRSVRPDFRSILDGERAKAGRLDQYMREQYKKAVDDGQEYAAESIARILYESGVDAMGFRKQDPEEYEYWFRFFLHELRKTVQP